MQITYICDSPYFLMVIHMIVFLSYLYQHVGVSIRVGVIRVRVLLMSTSPYQEKPQPHWMAWKGTMFVLLTLLLNTSLTTKVLQNRQHSITLTHTYPNLTVVDTSFMGHLEKLEFKDIQCALLAPSNRTGQHFWPFDFVTLAALRWLLVDSPS